MSHHCKPPRRWWPYSHREPGAVWVCRTCNSVWMWDPPAGIEEAIDRALRGGQ